MPAIPFEGSAESVIERIAECVYHWPRTHIVSHQANYLRLTFRTLVFGFVDDVEFLADETTHLLHFRSASRLGYSDLGVNRRRMTKIGRQLAKLLSER